MSAETAARAIDSATAAAPAAVAVADDAQTQARRDRARSVLATLASERVAVRVFALYTVAAWLLLQFNWGQGRWFSRDDWFLLTDRDGGSLFSVLEPHGEHPAAVPAVIYRVLFNAVGLRFGAYLMVVVTMHIAVTVLLRVLMRRAGVAPWIATIAAGAFALYGSGEENILWAFQITLVGSVVFGLAQLVLADHGGPLGRRDYLGLAAGLLSTFSSGVGPIMVVVVGAVCGCKRSEKVAIFHVAPPAALYVIWYVTTDPRTFGDSPASNLSTTLRWAGEGLRVPFVDLAQTTVVAWALAGLALAGVALALWQTRPRVWASKVTTPILMVGAAPLFLAVVSLGRSWAGLQAAASGRYSYIATALLLPAIAVGANTVARTFRWTVLPVVAVLVTGIPGNIERFDSSPVFNSNYYMLNKNIVLGIANEPLLDLVPGWVRFLPESYNGPLTVDWLRRARDDGRIPEAGLIDPGLAGSFPLRLALAQGDFLLPPPDAFCFESNEPIDVHLEPGEALRIYTNVDVTQLDLGNPVSYPVTYNVADGNGSLQAIYPLDVRIDGPFALAFTACKAG